MLVTALEANADVPKMEVVTERLLHEETKQKERGTCEVSTEVKAMFTNQQHKYKGLKCYQCGKFGHIKRYCKDIKSNGEEADHSLNRKHRAHHVAQKGSSSDSDEIGLMMSHVPSIPRPNGKYDTWIIDSGATRVKNVSQSERLLTFCDLSQ